MMMKTTRNRPSLRYHRRPRPKLTSSSTKPTSEGTYLQYIVVQKYGMPVRLSLFQLSTNQVAERDSQLFGMSRLVSGIFSLFSLAPSTSMHA